MGKSMINNITLLAIQPILIHPYNIMHASQVPTFLLLVHLPRSAIQQNITIFWLAFVLFLLHFFKVSNVTGFAHWCNQRCWCAMHVALHYYVASILIVGENPQKCILPVWVWRPSFLSALHKTWQPCLCCVSRWCRSAEISFHVLLSCNQEKIGWISFDSADSEQRGNPVWL